MNREEGVAALKLLIERGIVEITDGKSVEEKWDSLSKAWKTVILEEYRLAREKDSPAPKKPV